MQDQKEEKKILILGGTGHYGREIVYNLIKKGENVRVLSRNITNARTILGEKPEIIEGDITSRNTIIKSLKDVKAVIISVSAFNKKTIRKLFLIERDAVLMVLEEVEKRAIPRVVYISTYDKNLDKVKKINFPPGKIKIEIENWLEESNLNWTVIGAPPSMEIFFALIKGGRLSVPGGGSKALPCVSPMDMGKIVAETAIRMDLSKKRFRVTGPEAISFPEAAKRISNATGMNIGYRKIPLFPLKIAAIITRPFNPFLWYLVHFLGEIVNNFPESIASEVSNDHNLLLQTFDFEPTNLEMYSIKWKDEISKNG